MKHKLLASLIFIFICVQHFYAQVQFQRLINPTGTGAITYAFCQTEDNGYVVGGFNNVLPGADRNQFITKLDSAGNTLWSNEVNIGSPINDAVNSLLCTSDGHIIVGGYDYQSHAFLHRFSSDGVLELTKSIPLYPRSIILSGDDRIIVSGLNLSTVKYGIAAFDLDFNLIWSKAGGSDDGEAIDIIETSDGGFLSTGWVANQSNDLYSAILVTKADTAGNIAWSRYIGGSTSYIVSFDGGTIEMPDGGFVICFQRATNASPVLIKIDSTGNLVWSFTYNSNMYMRDILLGADGQPMVAAFTNVGGVGLVLFKVDYMTGDVIEAMKLSNLNYAAGNSGIELISNAEQEIVFCADAAPASNGAGVDGFLIGNLLQGEDLLCNSASATVTKTSINLSSNVGANFADFSFTPAELSFTTSAFIPSASTWCESIPMSGEVSWTPAICFGECSGSASISVAGGVEPYSYLWSNGFETVSIGDLCAGDYSVIVTDAEGSELTFEVTIDQSDPLIVAIETTDESVCIGECVTLTAVVSGSLTNVSYTWSPMPVVEPEFDYCPEADVTVSVVAQDATNCLAEAELNISVHDLPVVTYEQTPDSICVDSPEFSLSGGLPAGGFYSGEFVVDGIFDPSQQGVGMVTFNYEYVDEFGCSGSAEEQLVVWACPDFVVETKDISFSIWPNPATTHLNISSEKNMSWIYLMDQNGRMVLSKSVNASACLLSLEEIPSGVYSIKVLSGQETGSQTFNIISR
ncbi:MAG: T9SS type A sorting domain-containing protein [Flavobacteriales bacterium]|nr:T9SS type A sorting domain-containing protein [Flavobacteriales bacterium]